MQPIPANADERTIRKSFGVSVEENSVHGSDSDENAKIEIDFFFSEEKFTYLINEEKPKKY